MCVCVCKSVSAEKMDEETMMSNNGLQVCPVSQHYADENVRPMNTIIPQQENPQTKMTRFDDGSSGSHLTSKPKYSKKPDPDAPEITRPCSECGKRFWSMKAMYGHMRCHPERSWRGINPPALLLDVDSTTKEDRYVASCLLMLAKGKGPTYEEDYLGGRQGLFECTSCNKVFGSHQALGGHRASHKNVKGCFAITRNEGGEDEREMDKICEGDGANSMIVGSSSEHKCNICLRVFSSGQALGGHKRCHWDKQDDASQGQFNLDLNVAAPLGEDYSNLAFDLRLRL